jgi:Zn-dependent protease with chaperone function
MEHNQIHLEDQEKASNAYLMSLIAVVIGLPMPIINLVATGIFYLLSRKGSPFIKWHTTQALVSQIPLFVMNNILFWWTVRILLFGVPLSSIYIAYFILVNIYNIADFYATAISAIKARQGITYRWFMYGVLTDLIMKSKESGFEERHMLTKKLASQALASLCIFIISISAMNTADWMSICGLKPNSVKTATEKVLWEITSLQIREVTTPELVAPLDSIVTHVCMSNNIERSSINLHICRTNEVNAFAMGGRHILVNTGLINSCRTQHELAGVIAHELAHLECGHIGQNTQIQLCMLIVEMLLTSGSNTQKGEDITSAATQIARNYFIRENETEADERAVEYLVKARMNPAALGDFLERMESLQHLDFLSTHPDSKKRALHIKDLALKHEEIEQSDVLSVDSWFNLKSKVQ